MLDDNVQIISAKATLTSKMETENTEPEECYTQKKEDSQEPVLVLTPDYYPDNDETLIDVKVQLECPDISQIETDPGLSSTLISSNFQPFASILDETSPVITEVYSIHGGSGFNGNFKNSNYSEPPEQHEDEEELSIRGDDEYQEINIDPLSHNINSSLSSPKYLDTGSPINTSSNFKISSTSSLHFPVRVRSQSTNQKPKIRCSLCVGSGIFFVSIEFLNEHMKAVHNINNSKTSQSHGEKLELLSELDTKSATENSYTGSILQQTDRVQEVICISTKAKSSSNKISKAEIEVIDVDDDDNKLIKNQCSYCFKTFPSSTELANHIKNYHEQTKFECTLCSSRRSAKHGPLLFVSMEFLNEHMKMVHNISNINTDTTNNHGEKRKLLPESDTLTSSKNASIPTDSIPRNTILNINENKTKTKLSSAKSVTVNKASATDDYLCEDCYKTFADQRHLISHTRRYHNKESFCDLCRKMFATKYELTRHSERSSLSQYFGTSRISAKMKLDCKICFKPIYSQCEVYIHTKCHLQSCKHPPAYRPKLKDPDLTCDLCPRTFESELYFVSHKRLAHPNSDWQCSRCKEYFASYFARKSHSCMSFSLRGRSRPERFLPILYPADVVFVDIDDADEELISNSSDIGETPYDSEDQENGDDIEPAIEIPAQPINPSQIYMCDVCFKYFDVEEEFSLHLGVNHGRFFFCDDCQKSFAIKPDFDNHKNQNDSGNSVNVFCCKVCGKSFSCECDSTIHQMQTHLKEIGPGLSKIWSTDISNYSQETNCFVLQITGTELNDLTLNNNLLQFYCDICSSTFTSQCYLMDHRRLAHPNAKWKCYFSYASKCSGSYEFDDYFDLKIHMGKEHNQQEKVSTPFEPVGINSNNNVSCEICFATFLTDAGLVCHKRKHHRI